MDGRQFVYGATVSLNGDLPSDQYTFSIQVTDNAGHTSSCSVTIAANTNRIFGGLTWSQESYEASIVEHSAENTPVVQVNVSASIDSEPDIPYAIAYKLVNPNDYFKIDPTTGLISCTEKPIDREEIVRNRLLDQNYIYVQASMTINATLTTWSSIVKVRVDIVDLSDQIPFFIAPITNSSQIIYESESDDEPIFNFSAVDLDLNETVTFNLVSQVFKNQAVELPFVLDQLNGSLFFEFARLSDSDLIMMLNQADSDTGMVTIELSVSVTDSSNAR
jgi:hypothetical protein